MLIHLKSLSISEATSLKRLFSSTVKQVALISSTKLTKGASKYALQVTLNFKTSFQTSVDAPCRAAAASPAVSSGSRAR